MMTSLPVFSCRIIFFGLFAVTACPMPPKVSQKIDIVSTWLLTTTRILSFASSWACLNKIWEQSLISGMKELTVSCDWEANRMKRRNVSWSVVAVQSFRPTEDFDNGQTSAPMHKFCTQAMDLSLTSLWQWLCILDLDPSAWEHVNTQKKLVRRTLLSIVVQVRWGCYGLQVCEWYFRANKIWLRTFSGSIIKIEQTLC